MAKNQKAAHVRSRFRGMVIFSSIIALVVGIFGSYGTYRVNNAMERLLDKQVAQLDVVEQLSRGLSKIRKSESDLIAASVLMQEDQLEALQDKFWGAVETFSLILDDSEELLDPVPEMRKAFSEINQIQEDFQYHLEGFVDPLAEGASFASLTVEYRLYRADLRELAAEVTQIKKAALAEAKRQKAVLAKSQLLPLLAALAVVLAVVILIMALRTGRRRQRDIENLRKGIEAITQGTFEDIQVDSKDDLQGVAEAINTTLGPLKNSFVSEAEQEESQNNLIGFLEVVSEAADGDLTAKANVTADAFGSIADAYNLMVDSLAELMSDTRRRAGEVGAESRRLQEIFQTMENGMQAQTLKIHESTQAVNETSETTLRIAEKATLAQDVSARVDEVTELGNARVLENIEGMQLIRVTVQTINKKMKSLSERLLEIGTISQLISEVATRTTILAMNASIEAARAGDQGRGFLVISDEIKKLADKSFEATKQIGGIIKAIQTEAAEVTTALEEETRTVEGQTQLAKDTGEAFSQIQSAISDSKAVVTEIFGLSSSQQKLTRNAVHSMKDVSQISTQAMGLVSDCSAITQGLHTVSETLLESLSEFRLPGDEDMEEGMEMETILLDEEVSPLIEDQPMPSV